MKKIQTTSDSSSSSSAFSRLPDEIVLHILTQSSDLKTLCLYKLVCRRFSRIVHQVDSISLTAPLGLDEDANSVQREFFQSAVRSLKSFRSVKSLRIDLSPSDHEVADHNRFLLIKVKINISNRLESSLFLSANSVWDSNGSRVDGNGNDRETDFVLPVSAKLVTDVNARFQMLMNSDFPFLEKVYFRETGGRRMICFSSGNFYEREKWLKHSSTPPKICIKHNRKIPVLKLPVSEYVMKGVSFLFSEKRFEQVEINDNASLNVNHGVELLDGDEPAYFKEAIMEIFKKHCGPIQNAA